MRSALHCRLFGLAALAALVVSAPVFAASEGTGEKTALYVKDGTAYREAKPEEVEKAAHDAHKGTGMLDKLDFTGIKRWDLGIYTLIVFGLLMFVLSKFAWPKMREGLEKREANVNSALTQAKQDAASAKTELEAAKREVAKASVDARGIVEEARKDAEALRTTEREAGVKDAQAERDRAKRDAELRLEGVRKQYQQEVVALAMLIATKALQRQVSFENQQALLEESIAEMNANSQAKHA